MFILQLDPTYWFPVHFPFAKDGKWHTATFDGCFVRMDSEQLAAFEEEVRQHKLTDSQVAPRVLVNWRGVAGPDRTEIAYSAEALADACRKFPSLASNIVATWHSTHHKVAEKNF